MSSKDKNRKRLFLIDGPAIYYRAYFAFIRNPLINSHGENTSATFGFTNSTLKILRDEKPDYIAVIFDTKEPTFRHKRYSKYKANRDAMPEDLVEQLPRIDSVIDALNIPSYKLVGYEADDIMGSFTKKAEALGIDVFLVTGDKDMCQLVSDHVKIYNPGRGGTNPETMDEEGGIKRWGARPNQIIDFLALTGDSS
ncbi:MAG: DNA polymerase I, partial [candidate division Zixibacteria bacterium]|nr:DNA polymerase I [candidate division Zixibacteria bacterium]